MIKQRIFLLCSERGGSNLITQIFNAHPDCLGKSPNHLYRLFLPNLNQYGNLGLDDNWIKLIGDVLKAQDLKIGTDWDTSMTPQEILDKKLPRSLSSLIDAIYEKEAENHQKSVLFIKEVKAYKWMPALMKYYPDAKFIFQVRDPRDMVLSWEKSPVHRGSIIRGSQIWKEDQENSINLLQTLRDFGVLYHYTYENLIQNTEEILKDICKFLNLDFYPKMLDFHQGEATHKVASNTDNWKNLSQPILNNNSRKYKTGLSENAIRYIEYICSSEMRKLGYTQDYPLLSSEEFFPVRSELEKTEKYNKPNYQNIPTEEKAKRAAWMDFYKQVNSI